MIRVIIAEDQKMLRGALTSLLKLENDIEVLAEVSDGKAAWEAIQRYEPDVCLLDIEIPSITGLELAEKLRHAGSTCKIIIVTTFARPGYLQKAMVCVKFFSIGFKYRVFQDTLFVHFRLPYLLVFLAQ
jgi:two-component system response regulator DesR